MENSTKTVITTETIDNIDDFLPMPGAEDVLVDDVSKPNILTKNDSFTMDFLEDNKETPENIEAKNILNELDEELANETEEDKKVATGRPKTDKSGLVETFSKLFEDGTFIPFDDDKKLEEYTVKDWQELIKANLEEKEKSIKNATPKEFFESLPEELQYAAEYVAKGGTDLKSLFRALGQVQETRELDPTNDSHQELIVRQYLHASNFAEGDTELIEEQIQEWIESGTLGSKAQKFKPKLANMEESIVREKIAKQEQFTAHQQAKKEEYLQNIYNVLKPAELNGIKVDSKRQQFLWNELTTTKYDSLSGRKTNLLGNLLEEYQFGKTPRYDLIAETLWLLSDPDDYKENIRRIAKNEQAASTVRSLKTEEGRKISSTVKEEEEEKTKRLPRKPANIFAKI